MRGEQEVSSLSHVRREEDSKSYAQFVYNFGDYFNLHHDRKMRTPEEATESHRIQVRRYSTCGHEILVFQEGTKSTIGFGPSEDPSGGVAR